MNNFSQDTRNISNRQYVNPNQVPHNTMNRNYGNPNMSQQYNGPNGPNNQSFANHNPTPYNTPVQQSYLKQDHRNVPTRPMKPINKYNKNKYKKLEEASMNIQPKTTDFNLDIFKTNTDSNNYLNPYNFSKNQINNDNSNSNEVVPIQNTNDNFNKAPFVRPVKQIKKIKGGKKMVEKPIEKFSRKGHPWEKVEEDKIKEELKEGKTIDEISEIHKRSPKSIEKHIYKMAVAYLDVSPEKDKDELCDEYKINITKLKEILIKIEKAKNKKEKTAAKHLHKKTDIVLLTEEVQELKKDMKDLLKILLHLKIGVGDVEQLKIIENRYSEKTLDTTSNMTDNIINDTVNDNIVI